MTARKQFVVTAEASTNDVRRNSGDGTSIECFDDEHGASGGARVRLVCGAHEMWLWLLFIVVQSWTGMHSLAAGGGRALGMAAIGRRASWHTQRQLSWRCVEGSGGQFLFYCRYRPITNRAVASLLPLQSDYNGITNGQYTYGLSYIEVYRTSSP